MLSKNIFCYHSKLQSFIVSICYFLVPKLLLHTLFVLHVYVFTLDVKKETTSHSTSLLLEKWFIVRNP